MISNHLALTLLVFSNYLRQIKSSLSNVLGSIIKVLLIRSDYSRNHSAEKCETLWMI